MRAAALARDDQTSPRADKPLHPGARHPYAPLGDRDVDSAVGGGPHREHRAHHDDGVASRAHHHRAVRRAAPDDEGDLAALEADCDAARPAPAQGRARRAAEPQLEVRKAHDGATTGAGRQPGAVADGSPCSGRGGRPPGRLDPDLPLARGDPREGLGGPAPADRPPHEQRGGRSGDRDEAPAAPPLLPPREPPRDHPLARPGRHRHRPRDRGEQARRLRAGPLLDHPSRRPSVPLVAHHGVYPIFLRMRSKSRRA